MRFRQGSYLWLVAHDLRVNARAFTAMFARMSPVTAWGVAVAGAAAIHLIAWPAVNYLKPTLDARDGGDQAIGAFLGFVLAWMVAQAVLGLTRLLYDRGDLDLLLSSPLDASTVFAARATSLAAGSLGSIAVLALPIANAGAAADNVAWLSLYPILAALALAGTAVGLGIALALFHAVGPRRARTVAQLTAAALAGSFVLGVQVVALLPEGAREAVTSALSVLAPGGHAADLLRAPVDAARGDIATIGGMLSASALVFALSVRLLAAPFILATHRAAAAPTEGQTSAALDDRPIRFHQGLGASLRRKEWRLLLRDPNLFAQISLQIIYTVPVAIVLLRGGNGIPTAMAVTPTLVVIATQVAASLAWIAVSGEDAPELIAAAPVRPAEVAVGKLSAIAVPVLGLIAVPVVGLALISLWSAVVAFAFAVGGALSSALLNLWHPMPGKRRGMLRRHSQSKLIGMIEHLLALLWALASVLAVFGSWTVVLALVAALGVLIAMSPLKLHRPAHLVPAAAS